MPLDDEPQLLALARQGDEAAFGRLCARYERRLRSSIRQRIGPALRRRVSAGDVLQEAHLVAYERLSEFEDRGAGSFGRWLGRIVDLKARHLVRHHASVAKRAVSAEVTRAQRPTIGAVHGRNPSPSQVAVAAELREETKRAVERLPDTYREVVRLILGEGLTVNEAAERLGRSVDSVRGLHSRALARLARELNLDRPEA